jgi:Ca-activated chloride channel family protein
MHRMRPIIAPCALIAALGMAGFAGGGGQKVQIRPAAPVRNKAHPNAIRTDVTLVLVPVIVTDKTNRPYTGLEAQNFRIFDEGVEQQIASFSREDAPGSVGIVFDASSSMRRKIDESRAAIVTFLRNTMPQDEFFMIRFNENPQTLCGFTSDPRDIEQLLPQIEPDGWTALLDAIYLGLNGMKQAHNTRKALLVLSDGEDNSSRYSASEIKNLLRESDVRIFAISVLEKSGLLEKLAEESGGQAYVVRRLDQLPEVGNRISEALHSEYVLGFDPTPAHNDGKYRKLKIKLTPPPGSPRLYLSWRRGYYSPGR